MGYRFTGEPILGYFRPIYETKLFPWVCYDKKLFLPTTIESDQTFKTVKHIAETDQGAEKPRVETRRTFT
jgi:hypothetical protein